MALGALSSSHRQTIHSGGAAPGTVLFASCSHVPGIQSHGDLQGEQDKQRWWGWYWKGQRVGSGVARVVGVRCMEGE